MTDFRVVILGPGCEKCNLLEANVLEAVAELGYLAHVERITDAREISGHGVVRTPAVELNGQLLAVGEVPTTQEILNLIRKGSYVH